MNKDHLLSLLAQCDIKGRPNYRGELPLAFCPFHSHHNRSPSLSVNIEKHCYSCFSCHEKGHIRKLLYHNGIDLGDLFSTIKERGDFAAKLQEHLNDFKLEEQERNTTNVLELTDYRWLHPYLLNRGYTPKILAVNEIGFDPITCRVTIPIYYNNKYHGCIKRTSSNAEPKYLYPPNLQKASLFYEPKTVNDNWRQNNLQFYVEGSLDALRLAQFRQKTRAILGCKLSWWQLQELEKDARIPVLMFDNDEAGKRGLEDSLKRISRTDLMIAMWPENKNDPGELIEEDFNNLIIISKLEYLLYAE